ncbi:hypothetical protein PF008_g29770 [Phytophthora fragariae]|uniref:Uncharacterized protein n=1 Tax=Phytophthora fragariae TaxID=53985 RepID=A0A6G0Q7F9_9STRA|nr:hypothetical protein PF008_g29770 [Phytophthora fragariae]
MEVPARQLEESPASEMKNRQTENPGGTRHPTRWEVEEEHTQSAELGSSRGLGERALDVGEDSRVRPLSLGWTRLRQLSTANQQAKEANQLSLGTQPTEQANSAEVLRSQWKVDWESLLPSTRLAGILEALVCEEDSAYTTTTTSLSCYKLETNTASQTYLDQPAKQARPAA